MSNKNTLFGAGMPLNRNAYTQMLPVAVPTMTDSEPTSQHPVKPVPVAEVIPKQRSCCCHLSFKNSLDQ